MMRFAGNITREGKFWAIEVPILEVFTQGRTRKEAFEMIADAIEMLVDKKGFKVDVYPGKSGYFEVGARDQVTLIAFLLRQQRVNHGLTLVEVARRLGARSHNSYARYEQGRSTPTVAKLTQLLKAVSGDRDFVLVESRVR